MPHPFHMVRSAPIVAAIEAALVLIGSCGKERETVGVFDADADTTADTTAESGGGGTTTIGGATGGNDDSTGTDGARFDIARDDIGDDTGTGPPTSCKIVDDMDAVGKCDADAPPNSFEPAIQWMWTAPGEPNSLVTPLVANLTDDDGNGEIDLCDVPDVVVVAVEVVSPLAQEGHLYVLDGLTGTVHFMIADPVDASVTPAIGDIDGDGLVEIVTGTVDGYLTAFEHDGTPKWKSPQPAWTTWGYEISETFGSAIALADMDNDGDVEIAAADFVADHLGNTLFPASHAYESYTATAIADLDGDGDQELVLGHAAYHHDGSELYLAAGVEPGYPQIADLDDDPEPEVLVLNLQGITVLEHTGQVKYQGLRPTGEPGVGFRRPATVHDFDGDGISEFAVSSANWYTVYEADAAIVWKAGVSDQSGLAAGTAFDFLGDGIAEAMYADENNMFIFDGTGAVLLQIPRTSGTLIEYPVVADIDNDGSAEIVVVSNLFLSAKPASPTVQVIRDTQDRWIQPRRIWNQHTYHITNVREDGTIPQFEQPSWQMLNTYRTNAQIEGGTVCKPIPAG